MQENTIKPFRSLGVHGPHSGSSELPTFGTAPLHGPHRPAACAGPRKPPGAALPRLDGLFRGGAKRPRRCGQSAAGRQRRGGRQGRVWPGASGCGRRGVAFREGEILGRLGGGALGLILRA